MAKIILKKPSDPSLKKITKPRSLIYLKWLKVLLLLNILQGLGLVYIKNDVKINSFIIPLLQKLNLIH